MGCQLSRAELQLSDSQAAEQQAQTVCELGRGHAREWLKNPSGKHLALLRMDFQHELINSYEWGTDNASDPHVTTVAILELFAIYSAGVDEVMHEFVLLVKAEPGGCCNDQKPHFICCEPRQAEINPHHGAGNS